MSKASEITIILFVGMYIVSAWSLSGCARKQEGTSAALRYAEFACYDDAKETERHVGITDAHRIGSMWSFEYEEGTKATYFQKPGETCVIEEKTQP